MKRVLVLLLLLACGRSPDDLFVLGGHVTSLTGAPLDGVPVSLARDFGGECDVAQPLRAGFSTDGGLFSWDLVRVEVQSLNDRRAAVCLRAQADFASGTVVFTDLYALPNRLELPAFRDWAPRLTLDASVPSFEPVLPRDEDVVECAGVFFAQEQVVHGLVAYRGGHAFWQQTDRTVRYDAGQPEYRPVPLALSAEMLEDAELEVGIGATRLGCVEAVGGELFGPRTPYEVITQWRAADRVRVKGSLVPVSRGAACEGGLPSPCPLTDGEAAPFTFEPPVSNVLLTLSRPAQIRRVVLRGMLIDVAGTGLTVQLDSAGDFVRVNLDSLPATLEDLTVVNGQFAQRGWLDVELPRPLDAGTQVQLQLGVNFYQLAEISLFE